MKAKHRILSVILLAAFASAQLACSTTAATEQAAAAPAKAHFYTKLVDHDFVKQYAVIPARNDVMIIDSRPAARKYDIGHIPGAVNIPDTQFDALAPKLLPADKSMLLIFYCEGPECSLSHKGAFKAEKLGYTNIVVYTNGYPEWKKKGNLGAVSPAFVKKQLDAKAPINAHRLTAQGAQVRQGSYSRRHQHPGQRVRQACRQAPRRQGGVADLLLRGRGLRAEPEIGGQGGRARLHQRHDHAGRLRGLGKGLRPRRDGGWRGPGSRDSGGPGRRKGRKS